MTDEPNLGEQLDLLTDAVRDLRETLRLKFYTARRAMVITITGLLTIVVVNYAVNAHQVHRVNSVVAERERDRINGAVVACENSNAARAELIGYGSAYTDKRIDKLLDVLVAVSPAPTPEEAARRETLKDQVKAELAANPEPIPTLLLPRDCSPQAVTTPTLVEKG